MWEQHLRELIDGFKHPASGLAHSLRIYEMSLGLAQEKGIEVDKEALLAAAFLHDLGALGTYRQPGVDHAEQSVQVVDGILRPTDFPAESLDSQTRKQSPMRNTPSDLASHTVSSIIW